MSTKNIGLLFMLVLMIYATMALLPGVNTTVATITTPTYQVGVAGIAQLYPLIFLFVGLFIVLGNLNW